MCVCVLCVCVCVFHIVVLEPLLMSTLYYVLAFVKLLITFFHPDLNCITLCLFGALSCRVGALQISMIIIIVKNGCRG